MKLRTNDFLARTFEKKIEKNDAKNETLKLKKLKKKLKTFIDFRRDFTPY